MTTTLLNQPLNLSAPADQGLNDDLQVLLQAPFAAAWNGAAPATLADAVRQRLLARVAATQAAAGGLTTRRRRLVPSEALAPGVGVQTLYQHAPGTPTRPGEPQRVRLFDLAPGATLQPQDWCPAPAQLQQRELLVLAGSVEMAGLVLALRDFQLLPAGAPAPALHAAAGALLFVREAWPPATEAAPHTHAVTVRDADAGWPDFAPGIQRRVLWQHQGLAAMLYLAQPGAQVPNHRHGHDEECLMVQGELFLDDLLLQAGDYQLAPAGSGHRVTHTDTGVVLYAHGDLELQFVN